MFKGISCGKIRLVTRVGVAVCSIRGLHFHFFSLSQMQMYVKKYYGATFLHKSSVFVVKNDNTARFSYERGLLAGEGSKKIPTATGGVLSGIKIYGFF